MSKKLVPPDGGWGWLIVMAYSLNMICTVPVMQGFGLLFRETCADLGMSATDISVIISVNSAFGMIMGLINGPLLRRFGYRKIAIHGALCHAVGLTLSAWANSFAYLIVTYGIMCSFGTGIMNSAFSLALNSYFLKKRGRAVGLAMTLNGLGPILVPQLISFLMSIYGPRGTAAILGGLSLHALVGALLLQPLSWHLKEDEEDPSETRDPEEARKCQDNGTKKGGRLNREYISASCEDIETPYNRKRTLTMSSIDHDVDTGSIYGFETNVPRKKSTSYAPINSAGVAKRTYRKSISEIGNPTSNAKNADSSPDPVYRWWSSGRSLETINLGSSIRIFDESRLYRPSISRETFGEDDRRITGEVQALIQKKLVATVEEEEDGEGHDSADEKKSKTLAITTPDRKEEGTKKESRLRRVFHSVVVFFDFDLLSDPVYVNIMLGMSIAIFAELNFSLLTPFILSEMRFDTEQIATVMSCLAITDLIFRALAPFIGEFLHQPPRMMYLFSLFLLIATRSALFFARSFTSVIIIGFALGVAKGIRSVFMTLVISNYVPITRLASASGIQMVTNGIILITVGPLLGVLKDRSGSYFLCILLINVITSLAVVMWTVEMIICKIFGKRESKSIAK